jgi:hypothetical protein
MLDDPHMAPIPEAIDDLHQAPLAPVGRGEQASPYLLNTISHSLQLKSGACSNRMKFVHTSISSSPYMCAPRHVFGCLLPVGCHLWQARTYAQRQEAQGPCTGPQERQARHTDPTGGAGARSLPGCLPPPKKKHCTHCVAWHTHPGMQMFSLPGAPPPCLCHPFTPPQITMPGPKMNQRPTHMCTGPRKLAPPHALEGSVCAPQHPALLQQGWG